MEQWRYAWQAPLAAAADAYAVAFPAMLLREGDAGRPSPYPQGALPTQSRSTLMEHWISALQWTNRDAEALAVREQGVSEGFWKHPWCRIESHATKPNDKFDTIDWAPGSTRPKQYFYDPAGFPLIERLADGVPTMLRELDAHGGVEAMTTSPITLYFTGGIFLLRNGVLGANECKAFPATCALVSSIPELWLKSGIVKIQSAPPGSEIWAHCGPTNGRLRIHCALEVPVGETGEYDAARFFVGTSNRTWAPGQCLVFDESCEHRVEVAAGAASPRTVLIADFANPYLEKAEDYISVFTDDKASSLGREALHDMFQAAQARALGLLGGDGDHDHDGHGAAARDEL